MPSWPLQDPPHNSPPSVRRGPEPDRTVTEGQSVTPLWHRLDQDNDRLGLYA